MGTDSPLLTFLAIGDMIAVLPTSVSASNYWLQRKVSVMSVDSAGIQQQLNDLRSGDAGTALEQSAAEVAKLTDDLDILREDMRNIMRYIKKQAAEAAMQAAEVDAIAVAAEKALTLMTTIKLTPASNFQKWHASMDQAGNTLALSTQADNAFKGNTVYVWKDMENTQELMVLRHHEHVIRCSCLSVDGKWLAAFDTEDLIVWDLSDGSILKSIPTPRQTETNTAEENGDLYATMEICGGKLVFVGDRDVLVLDLSTLTRVEALWPIERLGLETCSDHPSVRLGGVTMTSSRAFITAHSTSDDTSGHEFLGVVVLGLDTKAKKPMFITNKELMIKPGKDCGSMLVSDNGAMLALVVQQGKTRTKHSKEVVIKVYDVVKRKLKPSLLLPDSGDVYLDCAVQLQFNATGTRLLVARTRHNGAGDASVNVSFQVWDVASGKQLETEMPKGFPSTSWSGVGILPFCSGTRLMVSSQYTGELQVWKVGQMAWKRPKDQVKWWLSVPV